jgi:hypothetical protein
MASCSGSDLCAESNVRIFRLSILLFVSCFPSPARNCLQAKNEGLHIIWNKIERELRHQRALAREREVATCGRNCTVTNKLVFAQIEENNWETSLARLMQRLDEDVSSKHTDMLSKLPERDRNQLSRQYVSLGNVSHQR